MFGLLQPIKEDVGNRLKLIKDEMNISFSEFGNRLGLKKPTISSYVQGYNLAPVEVIEKISKISGKTIGWIYFGNIEEYITNYLNLKGQGRLVDDHPEVAIEIKEIFYSDSHKNKEWENEFNYPAETFIDDCFSEIHEKILNNFISESVKNQIEASSELAVLDDKKKEELILLVEANIVGYSKMTGDIEYGNTKMIAELVNNSIETIRKSDEITFSEEYLVGKLINILADEIETEKLISAISLQMTNRPFSTQFGGEELVEVFQLMRPSLIKLYSEKTRDEFDEWF